LPPATATEKTGGEAQLTPAFSLLQMRITTSKSSKTLKNKNTDKTRQRIFKISNVMMQCQQNVDLDLECLVKL
jgi:TATA-box binding protein (TBP) (component of TFIID and TFIIIB)